MRLVAEEGDGSGMEMLAEECLDTGTCSSFNAPMCMFENDANRGVCAAEVEVTMYPEFPYLSTASMVFPSPDWCAAAPLFLPRCLSSVVSLTAQPPACRFTGLDTMNLCKDGKWVDFIDMNLYPLDAGTDSGLTYTSENLDTQPRAPITNFAELRPCDLGFFYNPAECAPPPCALSRDVQTGSATSEPSTTLPSAPPSPCPL